MSEFGEYELPDGPADALREPRFEVDARVAYASFVEPECNRLGQVEQIGTIFLTNRHCPFHCTMCDLWKHTLRQSVQPGDIPHQIRTAISQLAPFQSIKLYNSGNFFDTQAIPLHDHPEIAGLVQGFRNCIVENHPKLTSQRCLDFANSIAPASLEIALGLETCHEESLAWLNKGMVLSDFDHAVEKLHRWNIDTRVFLLLGLPQMTQDQSLEWTLRSIEYAASRGVTCFSMIPLRPTMPALQQLLQQGKLELVEGRTMELCLNQAIQLGRGRVFIDLWDAESFFNCEACRAERIKRLKTMNLTQQVLPSIECQYCENRSARVPKQ